jgi:hypothetical protein
MHLRHDAPCSDSHSPSDYDIGEDDDLSSKPAVVADSNRSTVFRTGGALSHGRVERMTARVAVGHREMSRVSIDEKEGEQDGWMRR